MDQPYIHKFPTQNGNVCRSLRVFSMIRQGTVIKINWAKQLCHKYKVVYENLFSYSTYNTLLFSNSALGICFITNKTWNCTFGSLVIRH